jgi:two-component system OmpR family response regulator
VARILVVDDDRDILALIRTRLVLEGHQVLTASDGPSALMALQGRDLPEVAVLDIGMPLMDGFTLAGKLRQQHGLEDLPIVFLTARVGEQDVQRGLGMGARYLTKPFMAGALIHFVEMALQDRHVAAGW